MGPAFLISSNSSLIGLISSVKSTVAEINPNITLNFRALNTQIKESLLRERLMATVFRIAAWMMANKDLAKMQTHAMEPEGKYVTRDGKYCGIAGVVVGGLSLLVVLATMFRF